jgi:hypothetical protein
MAHYTLAARINAGDGIFPFVNMQFPKNHRLNPIEGATYYLHPTSRGKRTPIRITAYLDETRPLAGSWKALVRLRPLSRPAFCCSASSY